MMPRLRNKQLASVKDVEVYDQQNHARPFIHHKETVQMLHSNVPVSVPAHSIHTGETKASRHQKQASTSAKVFCNWFSVLYGSSLAANGSTAAIPNKLADPPSSLPPRTVPRTFLPAV